jgi:hypothetical protein
MGISSNVSNSAMKQKTWHIAAGSTEGSEVDCRNHCDATFWRGGCTSGQDTTMMASLIVYIHHDCQSFSKVSQLQALHVPGLYVVFRPTALLGRHFDRVLPEVYAIGLVVPAAHEGSQSAIPRMRCEHLRQKKGPATYETRGMSRQLANCSKVALNQVILVGVAVTTQLLPAAEHHLTW